MALVTALVLVHQVHLNVADLATRAQVILPDQTIEVDGGGGACIRLVVRHFRHGCQIGPQFVQDGRGFFDRCAGWHIDDDLKFGFVVERQHFQQHQPGGRQYQRQHNQPPNAHTEQTPVATAALVVQQRFENPLKQRAELAGQAGGLARRVAGVVVAFLHPQPCQPGRNHEGNGQ